MNSSFYLMHVERDGVHTLYDVEFIVESEIQSLLTIKIAEGKIQGIICYPVDPSAMIKHIDDDRDGRSAAFIYGGEYFPEGKIVHMIDRAIDEYEGDL